MNLTHLSLTNFRSFARLDLDVPRRAILLVGKNAQGKTSILEAIYYLATFSSFQTHADRQLVNFLAAASSPNLSVARIVGDFRSQTGSHRLEARIILEPGCTQNGQRARKEILLDGIKRPASEVIGQFNAALYTPQMSQVLEGGPEERRRLLNLSLAQVIPGYARALSEYQKALEQRNALLKLLAERGGDRLQLDFWDSNLAETGAQLIFWRIQSIQELGKLARRAHLALTRGQEVLRLAYAPGFDPLPRLNGQLSLNIETEVDRSGCDLPSIRKGFLEALRRLHAEEIQRGVTTIGPHRDDLRFFDVKTDLGHYGSRGQVRTALLSFKLAEIAWMKEKTGEWPVVLLDEVMAELDSERRANLLSTLSGLDQTLLTTTDEHFFTPEFAQVSTLFHVQAGTVTMRG